MAVAVAEAHRGLGLGARERGVIMEAFGAGLVLEPYWSSAVMCADLQQTLRQSADHTEGRQAFKEKRAAVFTGR